MGECFQHGRCTILACTVPSRSTVTIDYRSRKPVNMRSVSVVAYASSRRFFFQSDLSARQLLGNATEYARAGGYSGI